ncbi:hypothetical protein HNY73_013076 [Argiope bruennichi]|uniref:Uncharacterized protein n=1 Tax=Argiope bruennichi TaxID=94029 RepID=A0A8T0EYJ8_ARGBR|nr:hypothetical protein HNY73_013076 [Argiope bruennichi]
MQFYIKIFILVNCILFVTKGQLLFNAITGFGNWYGADTFMHPMKTIPPGCIRIPCIPWLGWKPDMFPTGIDFKEFTGNMDEKITLRTTKKPKEKRRKTHKSSKKTEESDKESSNEEIRVSDAVRGGRDKALVWQTLSPLSGTSGSLFRNHQQLATTEVYGTEINSIISVQNQNVTYHSQDQQTVIPNIAGITTLSTSHQRPYEQTITSSNITGITMLNTSNQRPYEHTVRSNITEITKLNSPFQDQVNHQVAAIEPHTAGVKLNKTFGRESPLIQVYVIASGSGGAHTSIGEGGYHGTLNGQSNFETFHFKMNPKNIEEQKGNVDIIMGTTRQFQNSRKKNPLVTEHQEWNSNSEGDSNIKKVVEDTFENIPRKDSVVQLNSENKELTEKSENIAAASNHKIRQEILDGILKHEFQNHWLMRK